MSGFQQMVKKYHRRWLLIISSVRSGRLGDWGAELCSPEKIASCIPACHSKVKSGPVPRSPDREAWSVARALPGHEVWSVCEGHAAMLAAVFCDAVGRLLHSSLPRSTQCSSSPCSQWARVHKVIGFRILSFQEEACSLSAGPMTFSL